MTTAKAGSLSDLGNRGEAGGKSTTDFRSFEANSGNYLMKMIETMDRFPTAAVASYLKSDRLLEHIPGFRVYCFTC